MSWESLFERASHYEILVGEVRTTLATHRAQTDE